MRSAPLWLYATDVTALEFAPSGSSPVHARCCMLQHCSLARGEPLTLLSSTALAPDAKAKAPGPPPLTERSDVTKRCAEGWHAISITRGKEECVRIEAIVAFVSTAHIVIVLSAVPYISTCCTASWDPDGELTLREVSRRPVQTMESTSAEQKIVACGVGVDVAAAAAAADEPLEEAEPELVLLARHRCCCGCCGSRTAQTQRVAPASALARKLPSAENAQRVIDARWLRSTDVARVVKPAPASELSAKPGELRLLALPRAAAEGVPISTSSDSPSPPPPPLSPAVAAAAATRCSTATGSTAGTATGGGAAAEELPADVEADAAATAASPRSAARKRGSSVLAVSPGSAASAVAAASAAIASALVRPTRWERRWARSSQF